MKPLGTKALRKLLNDLDENGPAERVEEMLDQFTWKEFREVADWYAAKQLSRGPDLLTAFCNLINEDQIPEFRAEWFDEEITDEQLLKTGEELRQIWPALVSGTVPESDPVFSWWEAKPYDGPGWLIFPFTMRVVPISNVRAQLALALVENWRKLAICANPQCGRYYVARRTDQKYCLDEGCLKYGNRIRAKRHYWDKVTKPAQQKKGKTRGTRKAR